jgi:HPt (histidine-containing phosphotransfer) domain-containing protein
MNAAEDQAPATAASAIDRTHLAQVTLCNRNLEREILTLFDRQAALLMARIRSGTPSMAAGLVHTLKGSGASIGAGSVVRAAEAVERAASKNASDYEPAVGHLADAVDEARAAIFAILQLR